ncbi:serine-type endopeptidase inhibitor [Branchiostoma belcheri]|nr:serine-type endopeptidase inhibitor [Branchiostoma belcheri]
MELAPWRKASEMEISTSVALLFSSRARVLKTTLFRIWRLLLSKPEERPVRRPGWWESDKDMVHLKDGPHKGTKANVSYRLKCEEPNCNNTYIGETTIFHHLQHNQGHSFKLESTGILDRETRWWERGVKEAIYERMYNPTLNREGGLRVELGIWHSQPRGQTTLKLLMEQLSGANTEFALSLYRQLCGDGGNVFFSPYSISVALAMTSLGACGSTEAAMKGTLCFKDMSNDVLHSTFSTLHQQLYASDKCTLQTANRLYGEQTYSFLQDFLDATRKNYGAELASVDFKGAAEQVRGNINKWVEEQTKDKIKDLIPAGAVDSMTSTLQSVLLTPKLPSTLKTWSSHLLLRRPLGRLQVGSGAVVISLITSWVGVALEMLVLVNAIYFKGTWHKQFTTEVTWDEDFNINNNEKVKVPMMKMDDKFKYGKFKDLKFCVLELPYVGKELSMLIFLPDEVEGIRDLESDLTATILQTVSSQMKKRMIRVRLPRFKLEQDFSLGNTLKKMGMGEAFGDGADFSGMSAAADLFISEVVHKAFVEVNEEGTEAAAGSGVIMVTLSAPLFPPPEFIVDVPFLFLISSVQLCAFLWTSIPPLSLD